MLREFEMMNLKRFCYCRSDLGFSSKFSEPAWRLVKHLKRFKTLTLNLWCLNIASEVHIHVFQICLVDEWMTVNPRLEIRVCSMSLPAIRCIPFSSNWRESSISSYSTQSWKWWAAYRDVVNESLKPCSKHQRFRVSGFIQTPAWWDYPRFDASLLH
jgi:hypothetical protein